MPARRARAPIRARSPRPVLPVPRWRSITAIFTRSRAGSAIAAPSTAVGSSTSDSVTTWSSMRPITRARPPSQGMRKSAAATGLIRTECLTHSGTSGRAISSTGPPLLQHDVGLEADQVGQDEQIGLIAGRDRAELPEPMPRRGVVRGEHDRILRRDSGRHGLAHHAVQVAVVEDVLGVAVVGAERDRARAELRDER